MSFRMMLLAVASMAALAAPAAADGISPAQYVANVRQHIAFLDQASKLASARGSSEKLRAFAKEQSDEQQAAAKDLQVWEAEQPTGGLNSPMVVSSAENGSSLPTTSGSLMTGRSVAFDSQDDSGVLMPSPGVVVLPQLSALGGEKFDDLYQATQEASLKELLGLYDAYSKTGTDPALRALSLRELPLVKQRLAELDAL